MRAVGLEPGTFKDRPIDYIDPSPKPIEVQVPLVEYFERVKRLKVPRWQAHFLNYLQDSVVNRHIKPTLAEFHAQAQLGKTVGLSQVFPAWCIGHDPLWRTVLAMYNVRRSQAHSSVVIEILQSQIHKELFPSKDGHLPSTVSKEGWSTKARLDLNDGQVSFNPVGLQSGMTGSGFDYLIIDDPYKEPKDAFSETVFENLERFWEMGVKPRMQSYSCVAAMFHRYAYDDFGGFLLNTGKFDYVRYAAVADGAYTHDETGQVFPDPLEREQGELIWPERFPQSYYDDKDLDTKTWNSMFQGRPSSEEGDFFKVGMIGVATEEEWNSCVLRGRGWDHAATQGAGDKSAGAKMGMLPDESVILADVFSGQLDTAARVAKQKELAAQDGTDTDIVIPEELAASGKDVVFMMQQELREYNVFARKVTNAAPGSDAKRRRAYNLSVAVNSGKLKFLPGPWNDRIRRLMRNFGASASGDDEIDAMADVYNHLFEQKRKGRVVQGLSDLWTWDEFIAKHGVSTNGTGTLKVPKHWQVHAALKVSAESHTANSGVVMARAPQNANLPDTLLILGEYKAFTADYDALFAWMDETLKAKCEEPTTSTIYLHKDSVAFATTIHQKLKYPVAVFNEGVTAGIVETNWYSQNKGLIGIVDDPEQMQVATDGRGLSAVRHEAGAWGFKENGEPNGIGQVWDCIRMIAYQFRTWATPLSKTEQIIAQMPEAYKEPKDEHARVGSHLWLQQKMKEEERKKETRFGARGSTIDSWRKAVR